MRSLAAFRVGFLFCAIGCLCGGLMPAVAGVSQDIQDQYKRNYENKAMFLKIPIYTQKQVVDIEGRTFRAVPGVGSPLYKVGEQFRITEVDFGGDVIKFRLTDIKTQAEAEIDFRFPVNLQESFPGREVFDRALESTFTEGLSYKDIDDAKTVFLKGEFDRSVDRIADATSLSRDVVLGKVAPLVPAYDEMKRDRDGLDAKVKDLAAQIADLKTGNLELESKINDREAELKRLIGSNASMRESMGNSKAQIEKLQAELRDTKATAQKFEREIATIQSSLNVQSDSNRDLTKDNAKLADRIRALQDDLKEQQSANELLTKEIDDSKSENRKMQSTIRTLTSNKNSIGKQYVEMKSEKEKLDDFVMAIHAIQARIVEEKEEGGFYSGKADIYVGDVLLGSLAWNIPMYLNHGESGNGRATFAVESIDYVKVEPEERQILRTLGERLQIRLELDSLSPSMQVSAGEETALHELGERENFTWNWQLRNNGTQDAPFLLKAQVVNKNSQDISLFRKQYDIVASNPIRRMRSYLEPVPIAIGVVLGFLLFGIVGIFRRPKSRKPNHPPNSGADSKPYISEKKL